MRGTGAEKQLDLKEVREEPRGDLCESVLGGEQHLQRPLGRAVLSVLEEQRRGPWGWSRVSEGERGWR